MSNKVFSFKNGFRSTMIDKLGICLSVTCGLHCIASIVVLSLGVFDLYATLENEMLELGLTSVIFIVGLLAFIPQVVHQRNFTLIGSFVVGFALLKVSEHLTVTIRIPLLIIATILMIYPHFVNIRLKLKRSASVEAK